jgi:predicted PurR-regulated permease PerM
MTVPLSRYLRGQVTVALIIGSLTGVGLPLLQFPYAILLGVLVAVFSVVPYVGLLLAVPLAVGVKLLVVRGVDRYRSSDFFQGASGAEG